MCFFLRVSFRYISFDWTKNISDEIKKENFYDRFEWKDGFNVVEIIPTDYKMYYQFLVELFDYDPIKEQETKMVSKSIINKTVKNYE